MYFFWKDDTVWAAKSTSTISFQWPYFESGSLHYYQVFCFHFPSMDLIQFVAVDFPSLPIPNDFLKDFFDKHIIGSIFSLILQKVLWIPVGNSRSKIHKSLGWHKHSTCPSHDKLHGWCKVVARFCCELNLKLYWFCQYLLHLTVIPQWKPIPEKWMRIYLKRTPPCYHPRSPKATLWALKRTDLRIWESLANLLRAFTVSLFYQNRVIKGRATTNVRRSTLKTKRPFKI